MKILAAAKLRDAQVEAIRAVSPELEIVRTIDPDEALREFRDADILFSYDLPGPLPEAKSLKWIQLTSAGAEHLLAAGITDRPDILVTTASGIHRTAIAEYTLWAMITLARGMAQVMKESRDRQWRPRRPRAYYGDELRGKTLGVLGLGAIGRESAAVAHALGMRVIGLRRSPAPGDEESPVDEVYGINGLPGVLSESDFLMIALPLTAETRGLIGERELRLMKSSAFLINIARGPIVDEPALTRALREGWIAGAALDVFDEEPLPPESELWDLPNLVITPHMAGNTLPYLDRATEVFVQNLGRYLAREEMLNVLDRTKGY